MIRRATTLTLALTLVPALVACGSRSGGGAVGGSGAEPRGEPVALAGAPERHCFRVDHTDRLPPFADLARVGTRGNVALWGRNMPPADSVILSVRYGEDGSLAWVRTVTASVPAHRASALERVLLASLKSSGPRDWGVRLRVVGGDIVGMDPSIACPAAVRTAVRPPTPPPVASRRDLQALLAARGRSFPVVISLNERGQITEVDLVRPSGDGVVDEFLRQWVFGTRFHPKLHDGVAVPGTIEQTLYIPRRPSLRSRRYTGGS